MFFQMLNIISSSAVNTDKYDIFIVVLLYIFLENVHMLNKMIMEHKLLPQFRQIFLKQPKKVGRLS